jgi:hypothetical protein
MMQYPWMKDSNRSLVERNITDTSSPCSKGPCSKALRFPAEAEPHDQDDQESNRLAEEAPVE